MSENTVSTDASTVNEEWRPVVGWEQFYEVSNLGRVRIKEGYAGERRKPGKVLFQKVDGGYRRLDARINGKRRCMRVHRLVMAAFVGPCPDGMQVNHKDGNKLNNHITNLEYVTSRANTLHAERMGLVRHCVGEAHGRTSITEADVREIRARFADTPTGQLAKKYGVTRETIRNVVHGVTWAHVPGSIPRTPRKIISGSRGSSHYKTKLTEYDVRQIRIRRKNGDSIAQLSLEFGLTSSGIKQIIYRSSWKHVN